MDAQADDPVEQAARPPRLRGQLRFRHSDTRGGLKPRRGPSGRASWWGGGRLPLGPGDRPISVRGRERSEAPPVRAGPRW